MAPSVPYNISIFAISAEQLRVNWFVPISSGGGDVVQYMVQWDVINSFQNVEKNGYSRTLPVSPGSGPVFCFTIDIAASSASVPRFARVAAYNGFSWSAFGYPTPVSATGRVMAPGAPDAVIAVPTDSYGILVSWEAPNSMTCFYGGDGGMQVTYYVVEWDFREDFRYGSIIMHFDLLSLTHMFVFSTPASQSFVYDLSSLMYLIGGRNILTGKIKSDLNPAQAYFVRVTAFNAVGAGVAGYATGPIVLTVRTVYSIIIWWSLVINCLFVLL
jgi:hypothetical protein